MATTATAAAKSLQSCPTLCDPIDGSPPGSPIPGMYRTFRLPYILVCLGCIHTSPEGQAAGISCLDFFLVSLFLIWKTKMRDFVVTLQCGTRAAAYVLKRRPGIVRAQSCSLKLKSPMRDNPTSCCFINIILYF